MSRIKANSIAAYLVPKPPLRLPLRIFSVEVPAICNKVLLRASVSFQEALKYVFLEPLFTHSGDVMSLSCF